MSNHNVPKFKVVLVFFMILDFKKPQSGVILSMKNVKWDSQFLSPGKIIVNINIENGNFVDFLALASKTRTNIVHKTAV